MKRFVVLTTVLVLILSTAVTAFDGMRKGFVLGGGLGIAPGAKWSLDEDFFGLGTISIDEDKVGFGLNLVIGYAWDEYNMIVYEGNVVGYKSDLLLDQQISQGFNGPAWYHYFGSLGKSFFTAVGIGFYFFDLEDYDANDPGGAILIGAGYEFARHLQIAAYLSGGKTTKNGVDFGHTHLNILISATAF